MKTFVITYKPAPENPEKGWSPDKMHDLVTAFKSGKKPVEMWRWASIRAVSVGDRVFLVMQGKMGPAVIGYGSVEGMPERDGERWSVKVRFENIVDPTTEVLANRAELLDIEEGRAAWRAQSSGISLKPSAAAELEALVVGRSPIARNSGTTQNPDWTRDELIVALDFYLRHRPNPPSKTSPEILELGAAINQLGRELFSEAQRNSKFRNPAGVYMKLMNLRRLDTDYTSDGKRGLTRGANADTEVWNEFAHDPAACHKLANAIKAASAEERPTPSAQRLDIEEFLQEAPEGRILTRIHLARERDPRLRQSKLKQVMKQSGRLACEVCDFDYAQHYGGRGAGFIECHHTKPVATLEQGQKTHIDDLALLCANCHRVIHRAKPWLTVQELKTIYKHVAG